MVTDDFIGVWDNFVSDEFCNKVINFFEEMNKHNCSFKRKDVSCIREDTSVNALKYNLEQYYSSGANFVDQFHQKFWEVAYQEYFNKYGILNMYPQHRTYDFKIQKTLPGEGYHIWHSEDIGRANQRRILVYILYLNDIESGGETEFLYFRKRISPKKGRLILFPCTFTHTHRGNPPLEKEKYIVTSWIETING